MQSGSQFYTGKATDEMQTTKLHARWQSQFEGMKDIPQKYVPGNLHTTARGAEGLDFYTLQSDSHLSANYWAVF